jgi:hypothetical protein
MPIAAGVDEEAVAFQPNASSSPPKFDALQPRSNGAGGETLGFCPCSKPKRPNDQYSIKSAF